MKFKGHNYYGKIVSSEDVLNTYYEEYIYPIQTNYLLGRDSVTFLEELTKFDNIKVNLDIPTYRDGTDTVFITFVNKKNVYEIMEIIFNTNPNEFNFIKNTLKICWD